MTLCTGVRVGVSRSLAHITLCHGEAPAALPPELGTPPPHPRAVRGAPLSVGVGCLWCVCSHCPQGSPPTIACPMGPVGAPFPDFVLGLSLTLRTSGPAHFCLSSLPADLNYLLCGSQPAPHHLNAVQAQPPAASDTAGPRAPRTRLSFHSCLVCSREHVSPPVLQ